METSKNDTLDAEFKKEGETQFSVHTQETPQQADERLKSGFFASGFDTAWTKNVNQHFSMYVSRQKKSPYFIFKLFLWSLVLLPIIAFVLFISFIFFCLFLINKMIRTLFK